MTRSALTEIEREVDDVGVLDVVHHGVRLPPRLVLEVVEVGEVGGRVLPATRRAPVSQDRTGTRVRRGQRASEIA